MSYIPHLMNTIIYYFGAAYATFPLWLPSILIAAGVFWIFRKDSPDRKVVFPTKLVPIVFIVVGLLHFLASNWLSG